MTYKIKLYNIYLYQLIIIVSYLNNLVAVAGETKYSFCTQLSADFITKKLTQRKKIVNIIHFLNSVRNKYW